MTDYSERFPTLYFLNIILKSENCITFHIVQNKYSYYLNANYLLLYNYMQSLKKKNNCCKTEPNQQRTTGKGHKIYFQLLFITTTRIIRLWQGVNRLGMKNKLQLRYKFTSGSLPIYNSYSSYWGFYSWQMIKSNSQNQLIRSHFQKKYIPTSQKVRA